MKWSETNYPEIKAVSPELLKQNILRFAWWYGCLISPEKDLDNYVARVKSTGHCACHDDRPSCPCPQAPAEIESNGYCTCRLFVTAPELPRILERIKKKVRANPEFNPAK